MCRGLAVLEYNEKKNYAGDTMFGLVRKNKDIEQLLKVLEMDAANNYKDAVQEDIKRIETEIASQESIGKLKENQKKHYEEILNGLRSQYQHFTHQDQGKILF